MFDSNWTIPLGRFAMQIACRAAEEMNLRGTRHLHIPKSAMQKAAGDRRRDIQMAGRATHMNIALRSPFSLSQVKGRML
ncbi:MAG: hypothetical protein CR958_00595 [Rhodobacterales bacterium]|nr:MAG: hypothetical protein CR958_00595 [Rhodobacterales bacterium]